MPVTEDEIRESLKQVIDPELFVNIIDLGLVYNVTTHAAPPAASVEGDAAVAAPADGPPVAEGAAPTGGKTNVKIEMTLTSPACPAGPQIIAQSKTVLGRLEGVGDVEVRLVMTPPWTPARMSEDAKDQLGIFE